MSDPEQVADPDTLGPHIPITHLAVAYNQHIRELDQRYLSAYAGCIQIALQKPDRHTEAIAVLLYLADQVQPEDNQLFGALVLTATAMAVDWGDEALVRDFAAGLDLLPTTDDQ